MPRFVLELLGQFHATLDGKPVTNFKTDKVRALLAYLAVEAGRAHHRESLAALLWPESSPENARADLRQTLHRLRDALGDQGQAHPFLLTNTETIHFSPHSDYWIDAIEISRLLATCGQHHHRRIESCHACAARLAQAAALYRGDFLAGICVAGSPAFAEWSMFYQQNLHQQVLTALQHLATYHLHQGETAAAEIYLQRQVLLEPWCEAAHRQLMVLYAATGRRGEAVAQYERCQHVLTEQLGIAPDVETNTLFASIRGQKPFALPAKRPLDVSQPRTTLLGRIDELALISETLQNPECRLLTLVGLGGSGKTSLAVEAANRNAFIFSDGASFCSLASLAPTESPAAALAQALGISCAGVHDAQAQVVKYLHSKEMLLVLDNVEHLRAAEWIAHLLHAAPRIVILATARHAIGIHAEWRIEVRGLAYPQEGSCAAWSEALCFPAVQLFIQHAAQVRPGFILTEDTTPDVLRICRQVEGLPLALQLAASWVNVMPCAEIADAIDTSLDFLTASWRDMPLRQQGLRATFDYSWNLLSAEEQEAFACLVIFPGEFCHAAARAAVGSACAIRCRQQTFDERPVPAATCLFRAFVEKALLQEVSAGRYRLHRLLRQYVQEKLTQVDSRQTTARLRYIDHALRLADRAEAERGGPQTDTWRSRLQLEYPNLKEALTWEHSLAASRPDAASCLARALARCEPP